MNFHLWMKKIFEFLFGEGKYNDQNWRKFSEKKKMLAKTVKVFF